MKADAKLPQGELFAGRYEIQRLLGEGDRKRTYLAEDKKMGRLVAVSLVKPEGVLLDPGGTEREARVLGRIGSHPNIVSLYEYEIDKDAPSVHYMIFQYLSRGTLAEYIHKEKQQSPDDILRFARQICRGLSHLHSMGLIHRDVSPENIWLDERHVAHLGDFDSAIIATGDEDLRPITTGSFAAPEERGGRALDARADLFSLGGVLYVLATGVDRPGEVDLLRSQRPDLPSTFGDLVASLLSESPDDRPPDAEDVLVRLDEIRRASNIDALIAAGESDSVEFKASLHHAYDEMPDDLRRRVEAGTMSARAAEKEVRKQLNKAVTKTIAAFLNSDGGTLLIASPTRELSLAYNPILNTVTRTSKMLMDGSCPSSKPS